MNFSPILVHHGEHPLNVGKPACWNRTGTSGNPSAGPFVTVYLDIQNGVVCDAGFETYGCGVAVAVGSLMTQIIKGRLIDVARQLDAATLIKCLGGLPLGKEHCAHLAAAALAAAIKEG